MDVAKFLSEYFTEPVRVAILVAGLVLAAIAYYWLAARAVQASKWWRIGYLPPFALLYLLGFSRRTIAPAVLLLLGTGVAATPYVLPHLRHYPWEKTVNGELHVTLTGLADFDYALLKVRKNIAVLQMANPDVTDRTLDNLRGLDTLYELDISNSKLSDAGLAVLKSLPNLRILRIARTNVTDDGFVQHLSEGGQLIEIDARETGIKGGTLRKWKKANDDRKYLN